MPGVDIAIDTTPIPIKADAVLPTKIPILVSMSYSDDNR
jgi:hypothetical protein